MSVPPDEPADQGEPAEAPIDFDPYRFGKPDYPISPEYAPPGYVAPPVTEPPPYPPPPAYGQPPYPAAGYGPPQQPPPYGPPTGPAYPASGAYPGYQPGPGYPPVPPQFSSEYPVQRAGNGKATAALVLGIASILLCWLSFLDIVPVVLAIVFGSLGRAQANRDPRAGGKGMALAGLICGVVGAVLAIIVSILFIRISNDCSGLPTGGSAFSDCVRHHL